MKKLMKKAHEQFGVPSVLTPEEFTNPQVDELLIATYLNNFRNAKMLPISNKVTVSGEGIKKAFASRNNTFIVDCSKAGSGMLDIAILLDGATKIESIVTEIGTEKYQVNYTPKKAGKVKIHVRWSKSEIPGSPFILSAIDPSNVQLLEAFCQETTL